MLRYSAKFIFLGIVSTALPGLDCYRFFFTSFKRDSPLARHNKRILRHRILQLARVGVCVRCARGPTKRCITLPGVNKPRGRGLARGSPLRLRLLLRLCISSAVTATPFTLIYDKRRPQYSFPFHLSLPLSFVRDRPRTFPVLSFPLRDCTKTADTAGRLVTRKLFSPEGTHLEVPPPSSLSFLISLHLAALRSSSTSNHATR